MTDFPSFFPSSDDGRAASLLACCAETRQHGLTLSPAQAAALDRTRSDALRRTGRVELHGGTVETLLRTFCASPYLTQASFEPVLHELIGLFYDLRAEISDRIPDDALIGYMKQAFDGECAGSVELLAGEAVPALVRRLNAARVRRGETL